MTASLANDPSNAFIANTANGMGGSLVPGVGQGQQMLGA